MRFSWKLKSNRCTSVLSLLLLSSSLFSACIAGEADVVDVLPQNVQHPVPDSLKIAPSLIEQAKTDSMLDVIIYLHIKDSSEIKSSVGSSATLTESIDMAKHQVDAVSSQLQRLDRQYRILDSLPEGQEIEFARNNGVLPRGITEEQIALQNELDDALSNMRFQVQALVKERTHTVQNELISYIEENGGIITAKMMSINALGARIPAELLARLGEQALVTAIVPNTPVQYELDVSMDSVGFDSWWNADPAIDGGAYDFGIIDSGVRETHPCLDGFSYFSLPGSAIYDETDVGLPADFYPKNTHGTHVTGIAACTDAARQGGAHGIDKIFWGNSGFQATTMANMDDLLAGEAVDSVGSTTTDRPDVINHSLGYGIVSAGYNANDAFYDAFVTNYQLQVTKSSGNSYWGDGVNPTITNPASAYNLMVVANMDDQNTDDRADDVRRLSSSVGPTIDDRKKPDITAPGTNIMSSNANWSTQSDFVSLSGTSMAAPHVASAILLLEQAGISSPKAQKAILINTADAWDSNDTEDTADDGPVSGSHWDKSYGWGYLDMDEAYFNRHDYFIDSIMPRNDTSTDDDYKLYKGKMYSNEKATLVWEKRSEGYVAGVEPTTQYPLSDINIRLYNESSGNELSSDLDGNDNVHQVTVGELGVLIPIRATFALPYIDTVIKVYSWSDSFSGAATESYALATEENFIRATPPVLDVSLSIPKIIYKGQLFDITATITNSGDVAAHGNSLQLTLGAGYQVVDGSNPAALGTIQAGETAQYIWSVQAPSVSGASTVNITDTSYSYLETYSGSASRSILGLYDPPSIDLVVSSVEVNPASVKEGRDYSINATVSNLGSSRAAISTLRYYLSSDSTISSNDMQLGTDTVTDPLIKTQGLPGGGSSNESIVQSASMQQGTYFVGACIDSVAGEAAIDNQCSPGVKITVTPRYPDCSASDVIIDDWVFEADDDFLCQTGSSITLGGDVIFTEGSTSRLYAPVIRISPDTRVSGSLTVKQLP